MRFKLTIEYAGTRYSGWQIQKNAKTIQGELERAIREATGGTPFELYGSGRTDAGVHALAQVAHLDLTTSLAPELLRRKINDELPADINILHVEPVRHTFHARHSAVSRTYRYQISRRRTAFAKAFVWWVKEDLDVGRMRAAAAHIAGRHDFQSFSDDSPTEKSTEVLVTAVEIEEQDDLILVRIAGSHFIWKMVRRLVGVLVEIGRGGLAPESLADLLAGSRDAVDVARLTAPAAGLFLEEVQYQKAEGDRGRGGKKDSLPPSHSPLLATPSSYTARSVPLASAGRSRPRRRSAS